jgi:DNA repair exonuclease SbcCD ATPase subunit
MSKQIRIRVQKPWAGYPGSTVQQSYAEDLTHGFLLWDVEDREHFDVKFCALPNPKPFVTIEWQGTVEATFKEAEKRPAGTRFRVRNKDVLTQKDVTGLTTSLRQELKATEVTFKNEQQVNRGVISSGAATLAKEDLRNPDVLLRLLKDYHRESNVSDAEWEAIKGQVDAYLQQALDTDDLVRNVKWSLRHLKFDNTFAYGEGNVINFDQLNGIVGIFGPNRVGKSSIVGTIMYALFNTTDRGSVKNLHVVNIRQPYCYTKAIVNVAGTNYVFERQTVKHESRRGQVHAGTALNVFKIDENGEAIDLVGEQRNDTEKVIRKLIGTSDDCLLTSVAAQDDVKLFINQGTSKRRKDLSRFLDLDIFDKMYEQAKNDVNQNKGALRNLPDRDWGLLQAEFQLRSQQNQEASQEKDHLLHDANQRLHDMRSQLTSFKDFNPVTQNQVEAQQARVSSLVTKLDDAKSRVGVAHEDMDRLAKKLEQISQVQTEHDVGELKRRLEAYRTLESSFESLKLVHEADNTKLKQQERSLKILDEVPCGDSFPECKFIKDAFKLKDKVDPQREKVQRALERLQKAEATLAELQKEGLVAKLAKVEQLADLASKLRVNVSSREVEIIKLETLIAELSSQLTPARQRLDELREALKNEENVEVVTLRNSLDELQRSAKRLDAEKLALASESGRIESDFSKMEVDRTHRLEVLQLMKAHELVASAFSRRGIPSMIVASQLPLINAEVAKILNGIVDFTVELEQDDDSDSMEVYIDYGDSKRIIELGSGMEKMIASVAIRVALINVSSLPKTDMFIIDESFGALDPSSVEACNRLLVSLKRYFKTIIVITHVEGVKDVADHIIEVTKVEKDAKVVYS